MKTGFKVTEHTADVGIKFCGQSFPEMLVNAAKGMFSLIVDRRTVKPAVEKRITITGADYEEITINWLREIHYIHQSAFFLFRDFICETIDEANKKITAVFTARGESVNDTRHNILLDIKLVTYHMFYVKKTGVNWEGSIIFDI